VKHLGKTATYKLRHFNPDVVFGRGEFAADLFLDVSAVYLPVEEILYSALDSAARAVVCISGGYVCKDWARQYCI